MKHVEALDCPCRPLLRDQLGGGRVYVHRTRLTKGRKPEGRPTETNRAPDRHCKTCGAWHLVGHPHLVAA